MAGRPKHQQDDAQEGHGKKKDNHAGNQANTGAQKESLHNKNLTAVMY
jgi:hypothetical protein